MLSLLLFQNTDIKHVQDNNSVTDEMPDQITHTYTQHECALSLSLTHTHTRNTLQSSSCFLIKFSFTGTEPSCWIQHCHTVCVCVFKLFFIPATLRNTTCQNSKQNAEFRILMEIYQETSCLLAAERPCWMTDRRTELLSLSEPTFT